MVFPARITDRDNRAGQHALQQLGADAQASGSTERLRGDRAALRDHGRVRSEQQLLHGRVVGGDAFDRQIAARGGLRDALTLGLGHRAQHRNPPVFGEIDADAQVDFLGPQIMGERLVQTEDRVPWRQFDAGKQ